MKWFKNFDVSVGAVHYATATGKPYIWYYKKPSRKSSPQSHLLVKSKTPALFEIVPEGFSVKIAKHLGFTAEFQTNDKEFDGRFYIFSDDVQLCNKLRTQAVREAVRQIFDAGGKHIEAVDDSIKVLMKEASPTPDPLGAEKIAEAVHVIAEYTSGLVISPTSVCKSLRKQSNIAISTFIGAAIVGTIAAATQTHTVIAQMPLVKEAALYAIPVIIAMFVIIRAQFKGSSRGISVFYFGLFCGVPAVALLAYAFIYHMNIRMDKSPAEVVYSQIESKYVSHHKNSTSYHIKVNSWQKRDEVVRIRVSYSEYYRMAIGRSLRLYVHPGYFNVGWLERYEELK